MIPQSIKDKIYSKKIMKKTFKNMNFYNISTCFNNLTGKY